MAGFFKFTDITKKFNGDNGLIQVSGKLSEGQILVVKGPSGSGKSTLLKILARLIAPDSGTAEYRGADWSAIPPVDWRRKILYVSQKPVLFEGSVQDNLERPFSLSGYRSHDLQFDAEKAGNFLERLHFSKQVLRLDAKKLSAGEGARVAFVRALLIDPDVMLLDEPGAYLDKESRLRVMHLLQHWMQGNAAKAVLLVTHHEEDIDPFHHLSFLHIPHGSQK